MDNWLVNEKLNKIFVILIDAIKKNKRQKALLDKGQELGTVYLATESQDWLFRGGDIWVEIWMTKCASGKFWKEGNGIIKVINWAWALPGVLSESFRNIYGRRVRKDLLGSKKTEMWPVPSWAFSSPCYLPIFSSVSVFGRAWGFNSKVKTLRQAQTSSVSLHSCWLNTETGFIWSFLGPVCSIILVSKLLDAMGSGGGTWPKGSGSANGGCRAEVTYSSVMFSLLILHSWDFQVQA